MTKVIINKLSIWWLFRTTNSEIFKHNDWFPIDSAKEPIDGCLSIYSWYFKETFQSSTILIRWKDDHTINWISSKLSINMAGSIKLFQYLQSYYYQAMGIHLPQSNQKCSANWRNLFAVFSIAILFLEAFAFLLFKAKTTFEYGTNFYTSISEYCCLLYFFIQYRQMPNISKLIESCEEFIEKS